MAACRWGQDAGLLPGVGHRAVGPEPPGGMEHRPGCLGVGAQHPGAPQAPPLHASPTCKSFLTCEDLGRYSWPGHEFGALGSLVLRTPLLPETTSPPRFAVFQSSRAF